MTLNSCKGEMINGDFLGITWNWAVMLGNQKKKKIRKNVYLLKMFLEENCVTKNIAYKKKVHVCLTLNSCYVEIPNGSFSWCDLKFGNEKRKNAK